MNCDHQAPHRKVLVVAGQMRPGLSSGPRWHCPGRATVDWDFDPGCDPSNTRARSAHCAQACHAAACAGGAVGRPPRCGRARVAIPAAAEMAPESGRRCAGRSAWISSAGPVELRCPFRVGQAAPDRAAQPRRQGVAVVAPEDRVPEANSAAVAGAREAPRAEGEGGHPAGVLERLAEWAPGVHVPQAHGVVGPGRGERTAVGAEGERLHNVGVAGERRGEWAPPVDVP